MEDVVGWSVGRGVVMWACMHGCVNAGYLSIYLLRVNANSVYLWMEEYVPSLPCISRDNKFPFITNAKTKTCDGSAEPSN